MTTSFRIVAHKSHDWLRQHARRRQREAGYVEQWLLDQPDTSARPEAVERLREARTRLPEAERALLSLRFEDDYSIDEIAAMLAVPPGTVKSRLHYIKQRLRTLMEETP